MTSTDALSRRFASLAAEHRTLDDDITQEARRVAPDLALVAALKRRKLLIKDRLAALAWRARSSADSLRA